MLCELSKLKQGHAAAGSINMHVSIWLGTYAADLPKSAVSLRA